MSLKKLSIGLGMTVASLSTVMALAGVALADATAPSGATVAQQSSDVQVSGDAAVKVTKDAESQTGTVASSSTTTQVNPTTNGAATVANSSDDKTTNAPTGDTSGQSDTTTATTSSSTSSAAAIITPVDPTSTNSPLETANMASDQGNLAITKSRPVQAQAVMPTTHSTWQQYLPQAMDVFTAVTTAAQPINSTPATPPAKPLPVAGALAGLENLLGQTVLPSVFRLILTATPVILRSSLVGGATVLLIVISFLLASTFVRWLRHTGYSLAPRAGLDARLIFATPEMSFASATRSGQGSFLWWSQRQIINRLQRFEERR